MPIQWTDELATGVEVIDEQHRELYLRVAELHGAMRVNALHRVPAILEFLQGYALDHFATEEREMDRTAYPGAATHRALHQGFVAEFLRHKALLAAGVTPSGVVELSAWLGTWLREHVRGADGELGRHLKGAG